MSAASIDVFEIGPDDDDAFLAAWDGSSSDATLYRALRRDVDLRFVAVGRSQGGGYDLVHEDGDPDGAGGVVAVDLCAVPEGDDERFLDAWRTLHEVLSARQGHLGARLYRGLGATAALYVALARWSSPLMVARAAAQPDVRAAYERLGTRVHAAVYEVLRS